MFKFSAAQKIKLISYYPPYLGAGIRLMSMSEDFMRAEVRMKMRWWNKNLVGTHFGGSLASMADPFYMLMLLQILGRDYVVWDKACTIRFKKPGMGTVSCVFEFTEAQIADIKGQVDELGKQDFVLPLNITNEKGEVVCELEKTLYVRKKEAKR
jgi:acyl-coenzyme A thioesterase PaaI-like protein